MESGDHTPTWTPLRTPHGTSRTSAPAANHPVARSVPRHEPVAARSTSAGPASSTRPGERTSTANPMTTPTANSAAAAGRRSAAGGPRRASSHVRAASTATTRKPKSTSVRAGEVRYVCPGERASSQAAGARASGPIHQPASRATPSTVSVPATTLTTAAPKSRLNQSVYSEAADTGASSIE